MQKEVHEEAAAVAFTHAALWFLRETNVGDADCLSWSTADVFLRPVHSAVEMVWAVKEGRKIQQGWKGEMRASLGLSLSFSFFLGPSVVCNRRDGNWFPGELFCAPQSRGDNNPSPSPHLKRPVWLSGCPHAVPRSTALIDHFNILVSFCDSFTSSLPFPCFFHYLSIRQPMHWSIG